MHCIKERKAATASVQHLSSHGCQKKQLKHHQLYPK